MGAPGAPAPPQVPPPQAPPPGLTLARWLYVDERRTHEVHAGVRGGREFVVKEAAFGNIEPSEVMFTLQALEEPWEAVLALKQLESRLALLGAYWRRDIEAGPQWTRLHPDPMATLDLRPTRVGILEGRVAFRHYWRKGAPAVVLIEVAQPAPGGPRSLLAVLSHEFPDVDDGELTLLHARLPPAPARSILAREHLRLVEAGYAKLVEPVDLTLAHGGDALREARESGERALVRISEGRFGKGRVDAPRELPVDGLYTDYMGALTDPRVLALHARFLDVGEEERLLAAGEVAIKKAIGRKREQARGQDQYLLTILQASLLAREGLRGGHSTTVDPEVAALVRRFSYYL